MTSPTTASGLAAIDPNIQVMNLPTRDLSAIMRTQIVFARHSDGRTEKVHIWYNPEGDQHPHNHPWKWARSTVIKGSITEERFVVKDGELVSEGVFTYNEGDTYEIPRKVYHKTLKVEPGTITRFETGPWVTDANNWSWHNGKEDEFPVQDGNYFQALRAANPAMAGGAQWPTLRDAIFAALANGTLK